MLRSVAETVDIREQWMTAHNMLRPPGIVACSAESRNAGTPLQSRPRLESGVQTPIDGPLMTAGKRGTARR